MARETREKSGRSSEESSRRLARVGGEVREVIAEFLRRGLDDPRLDGVALTRVRVSPDLRQAWVSYTLLGLKPDREAAQRGLTRAAGLIRRTLGERLEMRHTPALKFSFDEDLAEAERLDALIRDLPRQEEE